MHISKKKQKKNPLWRLFELSLILIFVAYVVPTAKHALFPNQMTRLEKMLKRSPMEGWNLAVYRKNEAEIILTAFNGGRSITTEIDKYAIKELESSGDTRIFFIYSLNRDSNGIFYLTRTKIEADADLKQVLRLELSVCGRIADQHAGVTRFDGYEPVYECEVPVQQVICMAAEPDAALK